MHLVTLRVDGWGLDGLHGGVGAQNYVADSVVHDRPAYCCLTEVDAPLASRFGLILLVGTRGGVAVNQDAEPALVINPCRATCARRV